MGARGEAGRRLEEHDRLFPFHHVIEGRMVLSVVIPVYNEVHTLGAILALLSGVLPSVEKEIVVVDDCSRDGTREWLKANFPAGSRRGVAISVAGDGSLVF